MRITNTAIQYRTAVLVLTLAIVVGGLFSYVTLPKESAPSIEFPNIVVTTIYPGASPDDVESVVTQIIEQEISSISGIDELRSTSTEGVSTIVAEFTPDVDVDKAYQEVNDAVDLAKPDLPEDVEEPIVSEISTDEFPIMTINLGATYSLAKLKEVAEDLQDELEGIASVLEVDLIGGLEREVQINVDLSALKGYGLTFSDLIQTIQQENTNIPGGDIDVDRLNYLVRVDGQFDNPEEEIEDLVIAAPNGNPVYVRDVAEVIFGFKDRQSYARLQVLKEENAEGEVVPVAETRGPQTHADEPLQVISLNVKKRSGDNILETSSEVMEAIEAFDFPSGTEITITGDESENVESLVKDLENNIIAGIIFVVLVLLFFLGVRNAALVGVAIPLSMLLSFVVFQAMGQTLNFIILFSLIIALGMLVDNAVVIVENIYRYRENGYSRFEAARLGTAEVGGAVVASTATTVSAFAPMLFWPGIIGEFMGYMPLTLIVTLSASLFVALIINPVLTGIFVQVEEDERTAWRDRPKAVRYGAVAAIVLTALVLGFANWKTLVVVAVLVPLLYFIHTRFFKPVADRFTQEGLPRLVERYRGFLKFMLSRDYSKGRAMLRNTGALAAFTLGVVLAIAGAAINAAVGTPFTIGGVPVGAGHVLMAPGALLALFGVVGILVHTAEAIYLGGWASVKVGLALMAVVLVVLGVKLAGGAIALLTMVELALFPAVIVAIGLAGALFNSRERLILSDNRALLLNGAIGGLLAIVLMFVLKPTGVEFFPSTDPNRVQIALDAPIGTNIEASNRVAEEAQRRIDRLLEENPDSRANVENVLTNVGVGGDAAFGGGASRAERSRISLNMMDYADRAEPSTLTLQKLREGLQGIPGTEIEFTQEQQGPPTGPPVNIEISGPAFERNVEIARTIKRRLAEAQEQNAIPGLVDITDNLNTGRPEVQVDIDRQKAAQFGLSTAGIAQTVRAAIQGAEASQYRDGEDEYDITVRLQERDRQSLESLRNLTITTPQGNAVPLVAVADLREGSGFGSITRLDEKRVVTVSADVAPGFNGNAVLGQVQGYLSEYRQGLPPGYQLAYTGESEDQQESFGFLTTALLIGVCLIFVIMIAQFNSVSAPFIIIIAVGLSMIGVLLGLILTRTPFSLFTFIGIISLAGIVVNNSIVLVDYVMQLRQQGMDKQEAIIEGGATRLRPVLLTALTTILGLIPLTFGINIDFVGLLTDLAPDFQFGSENTQFWGPMGTAIISGLTFGTFLTLVIVPVMYSAFDSLAGRLARAAGRDPEEAALVTEAVTSEHDVAAAPDDRSDSDGFGGNGASPDGERRPAPAREREP